MAITDKVKFQWVKQPNGILRIIELILSIVILVVVHTMLSGHLATSSARVSVPKGGFDRTFDVDDSGETNETASGDNLVPIFIIDEDSLSNKSVKEFIASLRDERVLAINLVDIISAGNVFAIVFFLVSYISGESEFAHRAATEICFDIVHAVLNGIAGALLMYRRENPLLLSDDKPSFLITGVLFLVLTGVLFIDAICLVKFLVPAVEKPQSVLLSLKTPSEHA